VVALCDADILVERPAKNTVRATTEAPYQPGMAPAVLFPGPPPTSVPDAGHPRFKKGW